MSHYYSRSIFSSHKPKATAVNTVRMKYNIVVNSAGKKSIKISRSIKRTAIFKIGKLR